VRFAPFADNSFQPLGMKRIPGTIHSEIVHFSHLRPRRRNSIATPQLPTDCGNYFTPSQTGAAFALRESSVCRWTSHQTDAREAQSFAGVCRQNRKHHSVLGQEKVMSKQQAILETLLGAAQLNGDRTIAVSIRRDIFKMTHAHAADGYQRLARAASEPRRQLRKAAWIPSNGKNAIGEPTACVGG
jgi:hypothetical protein